MANLIEAFKREKNASQNKEEEKTCQICFKRHAPFECIEGFSGFPEEKKKRIFDSILNSIERSGVSALRDSGLQRIFSELSDDEELKNRLIKKLVIRHGMGEYSKEKNKNGETVERFEGNNLFIRMPNTKNMKAIRMNERPIGYDRDFGSYVVRFNEIRSDGSIDPVVKISPLDMLALEKESFEDYRKAA